MYLRFIQYHHFFCLEEICSTDNKNRNCFAVGLYFCRQNFILNCMLLFMSLSDNICIDGDCIKIACLYLWAYSMYWWRLSMCTGIWSGEVQHCPEICQRLVQISIRKHHRVGDHYRFCVTCVRDVYMYIDT